MTETALRKWFRSLEQRFSAAAGKLNLPADELQKELFDSFAKEMAREIRGQTAALLLHRMQFAAFRCLMQRLPPPLDYDYLDEYAVLMYDSPFLFVVRCCLSQPPQSLPPQVTIGDFVLAYSDTAGGDLIRDLLPNFYKGVQEIRKRVNRQAQTCALATDEESMTRFSCYITFIAMLDQLLAEPWQQ